MQSAMMFGDMCQWIWIFKINEWECRKWMQLIYGNDVVILVEFLKSMNENVGNGCN